MGLPEDDHKDDEMANYNSLSPRSAFRPPREPRSITCQPVDLERQKRGLRPGIIDYFALNEEMKK